MILYRETDRSEYDAIPSVRHDAAQAHRARWLRWYWRNRGKPLSSARRARAGQRNAEVGRMAAALKLWGLG